MPPSKITAFANWPKRLSKSINNNATEQVLCFKYLAEVLQDNEKKMADANYVTQNAHKSTVDILRFY